jgi:hypothetical protein
MSEEEVKKVRYERLLLDSVKGGVLGIIVYVLWGAYSEQNTYTLKRVENLEIQIRECQESKSNRIEQGIEYIIKKLEK